MPVPYWHHQYKPDASMACMNELRCLGNYYGVRVYDNAVTRMTYTVQPRHGRWQVCTIMGRTVAMVDSFDAALEVMRGKTLL